MHSMLLRHPYGLCQGGARSETARMDSSVTHLSPREKMPFTGEAVVVYLDILGFRRMDDSPHFPDGQRDAIRALRLLVPAATDYPAVRADFYSFADSIVRVLSLESSEGKDRDTFRRYHMQWALNAQDELLKKGLLVQGGVAEGRIFSNPAEDMVFGQALSRAYKLASEDAYFPRVAVAPSIAEANRDFPWLMKWRDDTWFIDYLRPPGIRWVGECTVTNMPYLTKRLEPHKTAVRSYVAGVTNHKELARCAWLVLYHNLNVNAVLWSRCATATKEEEEVRSRLQGCLIQTDDLLVSKEAPVKP